MASVAHLPEEPFPSRALWVGLGCKRGITKDLIEQALRAILRASALHESAIAGLATIDTKRNEAGLIDFCVDRNLPLLLYSANVLRLVTVPHPSSTINATIGTPSVAEAAALLACWEAAEKRTQATEARQRHDESFLTRLPTPYTLHPTPILHIPKCHYRVAEHSSVVTVAVARLPQDD